MTPPAIATIAREGLWTNNIALVQLVGLCPLLAVTDTLVNGLGLGIATTLVLVLTSASVSLLRKLIRNEIRIPVYVLLIATFVTTVELAMEAYFHELYLNLGIFVPLIVANCAIIGRAEVFASRHGPPLAIWDGLAMGLGFTAVLVCLGALRELCGQATIFADAQLVFGEGGRFLSIELADQFRGFLLAALPPGAFLGLGLIIALKNLADAHRERRQRRRSTSNSIATQRT
jgi:electron transport complex protein RnfE